MLQRALRMRLPRALIVAIIISAVLLISWFVTTALNALPPEKQAIEDRYTQDRSAGQENPAIPNPNAPPPYPDIPQQYQIGIFDCRGGECASQGHFFINFWQDMLNGELFTVNAGGLLDASRSRLMNGSDPGIVFVEIHNINYDPLVFTPINSGPVRITSARNLQLGLVSTSGTTFVFDVPSGTFVQTITTPDTIPPTCNVTAVGLNSQGQAYIRIAVQDAISGIGIIEIEQSANANVHIAPFNLGTTSPVIVTATKIDRHRSSRIELDSMDVAGNKSVCAREVMPVIDIKPGSFPNSINPKSQGTTTVAILSTKEFDALREVNRNSLTFGRAGDEHSLAFCNKNGEDVNSDGLLDLICHFNTNQTGFQTGDTKGILKGQSSAGFQILGLDSVQVVPK